MPDDVDDFFDVLIESSSPVLPEVSAHAEPPLAGTAPEADEPLACGHRVPLPTAPSAVESSRTVLGKPSPLRCR